MVIMTCNECGLEKAAVEFNIEKRGQVCFGCHVKSIRMGYTHTRALFNGSLRGGMTARESAAKILADNKRMAPTVDWEPAPQRAVLV